MYFVCSPPKAAQRRQNTKFGITVGMLNCAQSGENAQFRGNSSKIRISRGSYEISEFSAK
jgi:hypothetical protein